MITQVKYKQQHNKNINNNKQGSQFWRQISGSNVFYFCTCFFIYKTANVYNTNKLSDSNQLYIEAIGSPLW